MIRLLTFLLVSFYALNLSAQSLFWITDCDDKNFCLNQGSCTMGSVFMVEKAQTFCGSQNINYSYRIDLFNDGTQDINSSADTVTGNFAKGTHKIIWKATDNCGNLAQCTYLFTIKDCTPPNLICISGLTQSLDLPNCDAAFDANQFILTLNDNCTPLNQIEKGIRRAGTGTGFPSSQTVTFDHCDLGTKFLEVWVRDANGLTNQCSNYVIIQVGDPACSCNIDGDLQLTGCVRSANNQRIPTFQPRATTVSTAGVQPAYNKTKFTATTDSCFSLQFNEMPFGGNYQTAVRVERPDSPLNGVTTFDLVLISKHILGIESFTSAYQLEAADVNNSNSVTTFDVVETRKLILGLYDTLTQVPAWRFVQPLSDPSILPNYTALKDTYLLQLANLQADYTFGGFNFVGIKYGDVNYSAGFSAEPDDRDVILLETEDRWLQAGEEATVALRIAGDAVLGGWQMALSADPATMEIVSVEGLPEEDYLLNGNELSALWFDANSRSFQKGEVVLTLKIKALRATRLSDALALNRERLRAEAYIQNEGAALQRNGLKLHFGDAASAQNTFLGISPNPFSAETDFSLLLEEAGPALLEIYSLDGKRLYSESFELDKGFQTIRLRSSDFPAETVMAYKLQAGEEVFTGKLVKH